MKLLTQITVTLLISVYAMRGQDKAMEPEIDINKPVENPALVASMLRLAKSPTQEARSQLTIELNKAVYLAAVYTDEMHASEPDEEGKTEIEKDSVIKVLITSDDQGNPYLPLFTDWNAIGKYISKPVNSWVLPAEDAWHMALNGGDYHGIIINPGENSLPLNINQIRYLYEKIQSEQGGSGNPDKPDFRP